MYETAIGGAAVSRYLSLRSGFEIGLELFLRLGAKHEIVASYDYADFSTCAFNIGRFGYRVLFAPDSIVRPYLSTAAGFASLGACSEAITSSPILDGYAGLVVEITPWIGLRADVGLILSPSFVIFAAGGGVQFALPFSSRGRRR